MSAKRELDLGWCRGYMALEYHWADALAEKGLSTATAFPTPTVAIFSYKYCDELKALDHTKIHDFCFIGSINSNAPARQWVIEFASKNFTKDSVFINTDSNPNWALLGDFDLSHKKLGFNPKEQTHGRVRDSQFRHVHQNNFYFQTMCQSKYVLCPAGDAPWSFRFYEILMCDSIPMVESWHHTYRTAEEAEFEYAHVLKDCDLENVPYDDMIAKNQAIFKDKHMLH